MWGDGEKELKKVTLVCGGIDNPEEIPLYIADDKRLFRDIDEAVYYNHKLKHGVATVNI